MPLGIWERKNMRAKYPMLGRRNGHGVLAAEDPRGFPNSQQELEEIALDRWDLTLTYHKLSLGFYLLQNMI